MVEKYVKNVEIVEKFETKHVKMNLPNQISLAT